MAFTGLAAPSTWDFLETLSFVTDFAIVTVTVTADEAEVLLETRQPARLLTALAEADRLAGVSVRTATLEDVFLDLTGREYRA